MPDWDYGGAYLRHPLPLDQMAVFADGSAVKVHNVFDPLPSFMRQADLIFVDPPWNLGNLNSFYTKANRSDYQTSFPAFYERLFACIGEIAPASCYVEIGKEHLADFVMAMRQLYPSVTFFNNTYYRRPTNLCYVVRGAKHRRKLPLDGMDEADVIDWICEHEAYTCIGDLCMGRGLVAAAARRHSKRFVGTELNHKRLSVLLATLASRGAKYKLLPLQETRSQLGLCLDIINAQDV